MVLAAVMVFLSVHIPGKAEELVNLNPYRQVFRGKSLNAFGRIHRDMNIYQVGDGAGALPALCIQEGHKIPDGSPSRYEKFDVQPGKAVPYIGPFERYLPMVLAYEWLVSDNYYVPERYGVVQVYYWGCMKGYEHSWEQQRQAMERLQGVMGNPAVMSYYEEMKEHILEGEAQYKDTEHSALPAWSGSVQKMGLVGGQYELTLDISNCPQLADTPWTFPDGNWAYRLGDEGKSIIFSYTGSRPPEGTVTSGEIQGIENRFYAYLFTPSASDQFQRQLGWLDFDHPKATAFFSVNGDEAQTGEGGLQVYRHTETFESNYNIDLEKYCGETGQPLEGTVFQVLEDFDLSQVNEEDYQEGMPDGSTGQVYANCMSPEPQTHYICDTITTDENGYARHGDSRFYNYSKTYCMGHPAPEWVECDHEEDEECSCQEENERLREQWLEEQRLCRETCDFHVQNEDEDNHGQDTSAMEAMLADRDQTYEAFIQLEYSYHLKEKTARTGYILHGLHRDDKEIEQVILKSAQAGENVRLAEKTGRRAEYPRSRKASSSLYRSNQWETKGKKGKIDLSGPWKKKNGTIRILMEETKETITETLEGLLDSVPSQSSPDQEKDGGGEEKLQTEENRDPDKGEKPDSQEPDKEEKPDSQKPDSQEPDKEEKPDGQDPDEEEQPDGQEPDKEEKPDSQDPDKEEQPAGQEPDKEEKPENRDPDKEAGSSQDQSLETGKQHGSGKGEDSRSEGSETGSGSTESCEREEKAEGASSLGKENGIEISPHVRILLREASPSQTGRKKKRSQDEDHMSVFLPPFIQDDLPEMDVSSYGEGETILYTFKVWDHRTEGKIFINKRDLELYRDDKEGSFGKNQGDATLEGAVYGLFAAQDVIHPDGKSGVIYSQNDLTAVAATDQEGNAVFLAYTEKPGTFLGEDGTIVAPAEMTGPENLYNGSTILSSDLGFGKITYPDYGTENTDPWIGRPLLLGSYYIKELSRSEGYELSVSGKDLTESNRLPDQTSVVHTSGSAQISQGLSDYNNMSADGSWNDFSVESFQTEDGYDIAVSGYPENTQFYRIRTQTETKMERTAVGSSLQQKRDSQGNPIYETAKGGEYRLGLDGSPEILPEDATQSSPQKGIPMGETFFYRFRTAPYPKEKAVPSDLSQWKQEVDEAYLMDQVNDMLESMGYGEIQEDSAWSLLPLSGKTNEKAAKEILDWFGSHFFDCGCLEGIIGETGNYQALIRYDYSASEDDFPAVYDRAEQRLYVKKKAETENGPSKLMDYWLIYEKKDCRLMSRTASVEEKREVSQPISYGADYSGLIRTVYQPAYAVYKKGEQILDRQGNPIPVMERVCEYGERPQTYITQMLEPVKAVYDGDQAIYRIHVENETDWSKTAEPVQDSFRAVTPLSSILWEGEEMPYNQYLTDVAGAGVSAWASMEKAEPGSYVVFTTLSYPGQNQPVEDGGTEEKPIQVLQRVIRQSVKITKDISQHSYEEVNTYGSLHNDAMTVLLGLFRPDGTAQGIPALNQFKFKVYLKSNLESLFTDGNGRLISEETGDPHADGKARRIFLPPKNGQGKRLLEKQENGSWDYQKFFDAMETADILAGKNRGFTSLAQSEKNRTESLRQFALTYYDIGSYKQKILETDPSLNSEKAYSQALNQAMQEAKEYLAPFAGLERRLAIEWDADKGGGTDQDPATLQCNVRNGKDDYYNHSLPLPYGTYVIREIWADQNKKELANRHFGQASPQEAVIPFVPEIEGGEGAGEARIYDEIGSFYYRYDSGESPEELMRKFKIRFNGEDHVLTANGQDGTFQVFKYGKPEGSEKAGIQNQVVYDGSETESGQIEIRDQVPVMTGMQTAVQGKYAHMLVPWTVRDPVVDRINPDTGNIETLTPSGKGEDFNFVAFAQENVENKYYRSKLRIEKLDGGTGENIIHDGAIFQIYAAKRDVKKEGVGYASGTGQVLYGEAVDWKGKPVADMDGNPILYPRVGRDHNGTDLPIRLDREGIPQYDQSQLIVQRDETGAETGNFKAYSTIREVRKDGVLTSVPVGYIETYQPLGAGVYVLVEIQAPEGYAKSRPVAIELYGGNVAYYEEKRGSDGVFGGWDQREAERYSYQGEAETISRIQVKDYPSIMEIHKVEDGDSLVGNQNGLQKRDKQGKEEKSGGFEGDILVNDKGDQLLYKVWGRREKLEERGDVRDITYDPLKGRWYGYVTKEFDQYSEQIVEGTEKELCSLERVKPLYHRDGTFSGKGIRFSISVADACLSLYEAIELEKTGEHQYKGVEVQYDGDKVKRIVDSNTGFHKEILPGILVGKNPNETNVHSPMLPQSWDQTAVPNPPIDLYFYDLEKVLTEEDLDTGELWVLDSRGNRLCYADPLTGMAYVYDDYGRMLAYRADSQGKKQIAQSIQVMKNGEGHTIYEGKRSKDDSEGLPLYYTGGKLKKREETWVTGQSRDPLGKSEILEEGHRITRLPFGAYILQEEQVPYDKGYIQAPYMGLVLEDTDQVQKYFMQDEFTKTAFGKLDIRTQKEIQGAVMTLYKALTDGQGMPVEGEDGGYKKGEIYTSWVSGEKYDDDGNRETDRNGGAVPCKTPHWIDHIPVGYYVLEESVCPYEQGYVQSKDMNIHIEETGRVQSFEMEDDFTAIEILKYDTKNREALYKDSPAWLTLYKAKLDEQGNPVMEQGIPQGDERERIFTFRAPGYEDGQRVAATGRVTPDAAGERPIMKYDYEVHRIPNTIQGRYYYTENAAVRIEYLPVGSYVLAETGTPAGYATASPLLIQVQDKGHVEQIQSFQMGDEPLKVQVSKTDAVGSGEVKGARMAVYPVDQSGKPEDSPLMIHRPCGQGAYEDIRAEWVSGFDGIYSQEEKERGEIPEGFSPGDLKPHLIEYIPKGDYILREITAPWGFLQSVDIPFTIKDSKVLQQVSMKDQIPKGILKLKKRDGDDNEKLLGGARFRLMNKTLGLDIGAVTTDEKGQAAFEPQPIGFMDQKGNFVPYTYVCREVESPSGYMIPDQEFEFQFEYEDEKASSIVLEYDPVNHSNRILTEKQLGDTGEPLEGALIRLERRSGQGWEKIEEWFSKKQAHLVKDLKEGRYRLIEIEPPKGFEVLAEPIEFSISDTMTEIPHLILKNFGTIVEIQKTSSSKDVLLGGARLQLIEKDSGYAVGEWTSRADEGMRFYGLKPGIYIIHELDAPSGYQRAEDQEIQVEKSEKGKSRVQVFRFENHLSSSSGGGGGNRPKPGKDWISFIKKDHVGNGLMGAEFTCYDPSGQIIGKGISDEKGRVSIPRPEPGTYTLKETKAPKGYRINPNVFSFTLSPEGIVRGDYEIVDEELTVTVTKRDGNSGLPLKGARLQLEDREGGFQEGITGEDGTAVFRLAKEGSFCVRELEPPQGYIQTEEVCVFKVNELGQVEGETVLYNYKEKEPVRRIGSIKAFYKVKNRFSGTGFRFGLKENVRVQTGDPVPLAETGIMTLLSIAGFFLCMRCRGKKVRFPGKKGIVFAAVCLWAVLLLSFTSMAQTEGFQERTVQHGERLEEMETITVRETICYEDMEAGELPPKRAWILVKDPVSGKERSALLPLAEYHFGDRRWKGGFALDLTFHDYGAECYDMGKLRLESGKDRIPAKEPEKGSDTKLEKEPEKEPEELLQKLKGWEEACLLEAGLDPSRYRIRQFEWKGKAYEKEGVLCRDMEAEGEKQVADCFAVYAGEVNRSLFDRKSDVYDRTEKHIEGEEKIDPAGRLRGYTKQEAAVGAMILALSAVLLLLWCFSSKMGVCVWNGAAVLFLAAAAVSLWIMGTYMAHYAEGRKQYKELKEQVVMTEPSEEKDGRKREEDDGKQPEGVDEELLLSINPDYQFWISISGTDIQYPVVWHEDNAYYLNHDFYGKEQKGGCIFADAGHVPLAADNTILYGHNMKDGSMFAGLKKYQKESFFLDHPDVRIFWQGKWISCPVVSCYLNSRNDGKPYKNGLTREEWEEYLKEIKDSSLYETGVQLTGREKLLTLSTCFGKKQYLILHAMLPVS